MEQQTRRSVWVNRHYTISDSRTFGPDARAMIHLTLQNFGEWKKMSKYTTASFLAIALIIGLCDTVMCQTENGVNQEIHQLNTRMRAISEAQERLVHENKLLRGDNQVLREFIERDTLPQSDLELSLNSLAMSESFENSTTVHSVANPIKLTGSFRFRGGWTSNLDFGTDGIGDDSRDDTGDFVDARMQVGFDFSLARNVTARFELISAGLFENASADHNTGSLDEIDLYQGYVVVTGLFGHDEMGIKVGRTEIALGNELFYGNNSFYGGETFDATVMWWADRDWSFSMVWAKYDISEPYSASGNPYAGFQAGQGFDDDVAFAFWFKLNSIENHVVDLYYFYWSGNSPGTSFGSLGNAIGLGSGEDVRVHVLGFHVAGDLPNVAAGLDYHVEFAYEFGEIDGTDIDVDSFILEATAGLTFHSESKARLSVGFLFAEGADTDSSGALTDAGFVPLFPDRHEQVNWDDHTATRARWGLMDIIPLTNVIAAQLGFTFRPATDWILGVTVLGAWHDKDVATTDGLVDDGIGWEVDLFADYRYSANTTVSLGLGVFLPNDGAPLQNSALSAGNGQDDAAFLFYLQILTTF
ncbi:MAG: hypothetical protein ACI97A_003975 [Planctomycetota bacterium]|jgi:hypothetical protein